ERGLMLLGPAALGLLVGVGLLQLHPPKSAAEVVVEALVTSIATATAAFATFQLAAEQPGADKRD
ncbi:MAG: hypothetical protein KC502_14430, partial [Myxococcales bacterium]|nr:hypothetical protein [Myxococcales bacterium]